jgi:hypothetical protein
MYIRKKTDKELEKDKKLASRGFSGLEDIC